MTSPVKVYLSDGIYIPVRFVSDTHRETIEKKFERHVYLKEKTCEACEFFAERPCDTCTGCPNYKGLYKLHRDVEYKEQRCVRLPYGDRASVIKMFGADEIKIIDHTRAPEMERKFKMTVPLRSYQEPAVKKMMKVRSGVLKSAPRSGKTVMAAAVVAKHGLKTIILASQYDWLEGFLETFVGSDTQTAMTNIKKKRIGFCKTLEDFERYDICLCTYQTFIREKGQRLLKKIRGMFGVVIIDEIQFGAALKFSSVLNTFTARYRYGLSGTPQRKDCFSGNTPVLTPDGNPPIKSLKVGDLVKTVDGDLPISHTHIRKNSKMVRVSYEGGRIECTEDEEFWSKTRSAWVKAKDLDTDDDLMLPS